jgi:hypothetical protein
MITVFMEYKVNPDTIQAYESVMEFVISELESLGVSRIEWYRAVDQHSLYVECFRVQNKNEYEIIKEKRISSEHPVFSKLQTYIEGGSEKIHCWAFEQMTVKEEPHHEINRA